MIKTKAVSRFTAKKYTYLICGKTITKGFNYCIDFAIKFWLAYENGKFKKTREWLDWIRELSIAEKSLRRKELI